MEIFHVIVDLSIEKGIYAVGTNQLSIQLRDRS